MNAITIIATIAILILGHFIVDFLAIPGQFRSGKNKRLGSMTLHCLLHFSVQWFLLVTVSPFSEAFVAAVCIAVLHGLVDWQVWSAYRRYGLPKLGLSCNYSDDYFFWLSGGLEQALHFLVLGAAACLLNM